MAKKYNTNPRQKGTLDRLFGIESTQAKLEKYYRDYDYVSDKLKIRKKKEEKPKIGAPGTENSPIRSVYPRLNKLTTTRTIGETKEEQKNQEAKADAANYVLKKLGFDRTPETQKFMATRKKELQAPKEELKVKRQLYKNTWAPEYGKGNINLNARKVLKNGDGSISTESSFSFYDDDTKKEVLIPTIIDGKRVSEEEAINHYYMTGQHLGKFDTPKEADRYANMLHERQGKVYSSRDYMENTVPNRNKKQVGVNSFMEDKADKRLRPTHFGVGDDMTAEELEQAALTAERDKWIHPVKDEDLGGWLQSDTKGYREAMAYENANQWIRNRHIVQQGGGYNYLDKPEYMNREGLEEYKGRYQQKKEATQKYLDSLKEELKTYDDPDQAWLWNNLAKAAGDEETRDRIAFLEETISQYEAGNDEDISEYRYEQAKEELETIRRQSKKNIGQFIGITGRGTNYYNLINNLKEPKDIYNLYWGLGAYQRDTQDMSAEEKEELDARLSTVANRRQELLNEISYTENELGTLQEMVESADTWIGRWDDYDDLMDDETGGDSEYHPEYYDEFKDSLSKEGSKYDEGSMFYFDNVPIDRIVSFINGGEEYSNWEKREGTGKISNEYSGAMNMLPEEKQQLTELYNKAKEEGREPTEAAAFLEALQPFLNQRYRVYEEAQNRHETNQSPISSHVEDLMMTAGSLIETAIIGYGNLTGQAWASDPYSPEMAVIRRIKDIEDQTSKNLGETGGFFYQAGMSAIKNLVRGIMAAPTGGAAEVATLVQFFSENFNSTYQEDLEKYQDRGKAAQYAFVDSAISTFFEIASVEALFSDPKDYVRYMLQNTFAEMSEEYFEAEYGPIIEELLNGRSKWQKREGEILVNEGYYDDDGNWVRIRNKKEARERANAEKQKEKWTAVMSAAVSVAAPAAFGGARNIAATRQTGEQIQRSGLEERENSQTGPVVRGQAAKNNMMMLEAAEKMGAETASGKMAARLRKKYRSGKEISAYDMGKLAQTISQESNQQIAEITRNVLARNIMEDLKDKGVKNAEETAQIVAKKITGEEMTLAEKFEFTRSQAAKETAVEYGYQIPTGENRVEQAAEEIEQKTKNAKSVQETLDSMLTRDADRKAGVDSVGEMMDGAQQAGKGTGLLSSGKSTHVEIDGKLAEISGFETDTKSGRIQVKTSDGQTVDISTVSGVSENTAKVLRYIQLDGNKLGSNRVNMIMLQHANDTQDAAGMVYDMQRVRVNAVLRLGTPRTQLSAETVKEIQQAAAEDYKEAEAARIANVRQINPGKGTVTYQGTTYGTNDFTQALKNSKLNRTQREEADAIGAIAKAAGFDVEIYYDENDTKNQGSYSATGGIRINLAGEYADGIHRGALATLPHEITHQLEGSSPEAYARLRQFVLRNLQQSGVNVEQRVKNIMDTYAKNGAEIDLNGAVAELVAKGCEQVLTDEKVIRQLRESDPNTYGKIRQIVKNLVERIKTAIGIAKDTSSVYSKALSNVADELNRLWLEAYEEAKGAKGTATGNKEQQYSFRDSEGNELTITENEIISNRVKVKEMEPVINVNAGDYSSILKGGFVEEGYKVLTKDGKTAENPVIGIVELAKSGLRHVAGRSNVAYVKAMAIPAIKSTIEKGEIVLVDNNSHNNYDSVVIAAKTKMPNGTYYIGVLVSQDNGGTKGQQNRYSFHAALIIKENAAAMDPTELKSDELPKGYDSVPVYRVLQAIANSNVQNGKNQYSIQDDDEEGARLRQEWNDAYNMYTDMRLEISKLKGELDDINKRIMAAKTEEETNALVEEITEWDKRTGYSKLQSELKTAEEAERKARKAYDEYAEARDVAEEQRKIKASGMTEEDWRRKQAVNQFGYTTNYKEAGYLLPDGKMLNFSGEKGRHYGTRGSDHREIGTVYASGEMQGSAAMMAFMNDGNIRVMAETPGIDISTSHEPTTAQMNQIRNMASRFADEEYFSVDLTDKNGNTVGNLEYEGKINPSRVVNDIRHYFQTGEIREQSSVDRFRYSIQDETDMDVRQWMLSVNESSLQTEAEKELHRQFKDLDMKLQVQNERVRNVQSRIRTMELSEEKLTPDEKRQLKNLRTRLENEIAKKEEIQQKLAEVTGSEGYARLMYNTTRTFNDFMYGRTQAEVAQTVEQMRRNVDRIAKEIAEEKQAVEELAKTDTMQNVREILESTTTEKAARDLKRKYNSTWTAKQIQPYVESIVVRMAAGQEFEQEVEQLADILLSTDSTKTYEGLEALRGLTITLGPGQQKELKAKNSSLKEVRARLEGTGIKVRYGERSTLEADIADLREEYPNLPDIGNEKDALENFLSWVEGMKEGTADEFYAQNKAMAVVDIINQAAAAAKNNRLYVPKDTMARQQIMQLVEYVKGLNARTEAAEKTLARIAEDMDQLTKSGAQAAGMTAMLTSHIGEALEYYDRTAKIAVNEAKINRRNEIIQQLKSENAQKILKNNEEWRNLIERDKKAREQAEDNRSYRGQINTVAKRLYNWLKNPKGLVNVPEHMQGLAREIIETLVDNDMAGRKETRKVTFISKKELAEAKRVITAWKEQSGEFSLADLTEASQEDAIHIITGDLNTFYAALEEYNKEIRGKNKLDTLQKRGEILRQMQEAVSEIYRYIKTEQEINLNGHSVQTVNAAYRILVETKGKTYKEWIGKAGRGIAMLHKMIVSGNMTPEYYFRTLDNAGLTEIWDEYHRAENRNGLELARAKARLEEFAERHGYDTWDTKKKQKVKLSSGEVELTLGEMMSLWATWKREQVLGPEMSQHLTKGGFYVEQDTRSGIIGRKAVQKRAYRVNEADMAMIKGMLTKEQQHFVDDVVMYMSRDMSELGNEASMKAYGIKMYKEKYYFPFQIWNGVKTMKSNDAGKGASANQAFHPSFSKSRMHGANNALVLGDFMQTAADHITGMINYATMGLANENLNKVLNCQIDAELSRDPNATKRNTRAVLEEAYGKEALQYLMDLKVQLEGGAVRTNRTIGDKAISLFRKNAVAGSLSVALQQPLSYIRATMLINPKYLAQALNPMLWRGSYAEMMKYSGVAVIKDMGRFDMNAGQSAREYLMPDEKERKLAKAWGFVTDKATILPEMMDRMTWTRMWSASKAEMAAKNPGMDTKSDEFLNKVAERFNEVMRRTQVYDSVLVRSANMRDDHYWVKSLTSFMAEPTLTLNVLADATREAVQGKKGGKALMVKAGATFTLSAVMQAVIKGLMSTGRTPDDKKTWYENFLYRFWNNLWNEGDFMQLIPGYSDLITLLKDGEVNDDAMGAIGKMFTAGKNSINMLLGNKEASYRNFEDSFGQLVQLFSGLPAKNLMRDGRAMYNWIIKHPYAERETDKNVLSNQFWESIFNADNLIGVVNGLLGEAGYNTSNKGYYQRAYEAMKEGNEEQVQNNIDYLLNGKGVKKEKTIHTEIQKLIKEDYAAGKITKDEAVALMKKNNPDIKEKDIFKAMEEIEYEKETGENVQNYSVYQPIYDLIDEDGDIAERTQYMIDNGYKETDVKQSVKSYISDQYEDEEISREEAERKLKKYRPDMDAEEIWFTLDKADYKRDGGKQTGDKYYRLYDALDTGDVNKANAIKAELAQHGVKEKQTDSQIQSYLMDLYKEGKLKREETIRELKRFRPDLTDDDIWMALDKVDYKKETDDDEVSGKYYRLKDALSAGDDKALQQARKDLIAHGTKEKDVDNQIKSITVDQYKQEEIDRETAEKRLKQYNKDLKANDIWFILDKADYQKNGGQQSSEKYYRLYDAMEANKAADIQSAVKMLVKHGVEKKNIRTSINNHYKELYKKASRDEKRKIRDAMQKAYKAAGYTAEDANKVISKWK